MKHRWLAAWLLVPLVTQAKVEITADARLELEMSIYNQNFAVIRDARSVAIGKGEAVLEFRDIPRTIVPQSVTLASDAARGFIAAQQNYRYDLLNRESLLERYVGRKVKYSRMILEEDNTYEKLLREGILLSINPEIVKFGDVIEVEPEGTISLPSIPADLRTTPTLVFQGANGRDARQTLNLRYHAGGIGWEADYTLNLDRRTTLSGWLTVTNQTGSDYDVDGLQLIAGEVYRAAVPAAPGLVRGAAMEMMADAAMPPRSVAGDYHSYDIPGRVTLTKNDMTQLRLIDASGIWVEKSYRLVSNVNRYASEAAESQSPESVLTFANSARNNLNVPLPAGTLRVYEAGQFIGESRTQHKAAGETIEVTLGRAFDVKVKRSQLNYRRIADRSVEIEYSIELTNAGERPVTVILEEKLSGDWDVVRESVKGRKADARTLVFEPSVQAKGQSSLKYTVRMSW